MMKVKNCFGIIFLLLSSILVGIANQAIADQFTPQYTEAEITSTASSVELVGISGHYSTVNLDTGTIEQYGLAYTAFAGAAAVKMTDDFYNEFSVPVAGVYNLEFSGHVFSNVFELGETFLAGGMEADFVIKLSGGIINQNSSTEIVYETERTPTAFLSDTANQSISNWMDYAALGANKHLKTGIEIYNAVNEISDFVGRIPEFNRFAIRLPVYLEAGSHHWFFKSESQTGAYALGFSAMYSSSIVISKLESVNITPALPYHTIESSAGPDGSISPQGVVYVNQGDSITFRAIPDTGHVVNRWQVNNSNVQSGVSSYTIQNVEQDYRISVTFDDAPPIDIEQEPIVGWDDTYITAARPDRNIGRLNVMDISTGPPHSLGLIKFYFDDIPLGSTIEKATLRLRCGMGTVDPGDLFITDAGSDWQEHTVTWNTQPNYGTDLRLWWEIGQDSTNLITSPDMTNLVANWFDGSTPNYGFYLMAGDAPTTFRITASDSVDYTNRPTLLVDYRKPPAPDLVVSNITPDPAPVNNTFIVGDTVDFNVTVTNITAGYAPESEVGYYIGTAYNDTSTPMADPADNVRALGPGESYTRTSEYTFTAADTDKRFIIAIADHDQEVDEITNRNNFLEYGPFTVSLPKVAPPQITPFGGHFDSPISVEINCATPNTEIRYTTDGTNPTQISALYAGAFTLKSSAIIKTCAFKDNYLASEIYGASYTVILPRVATPQITPEGRTFETIPPITLSCTTPDATIHYTIDSTLPTADSIEYTGPITATTESFVLYARAYKNDDHRPSLAATATFTLEGSPPVLSVFPESILAKFNAQSAAYTVRNVGTGNMAWSAAVISGHAWLSIADINMDTGNVEIALTENSGQQSRTGIIRVEALGASGSPKDITVIQSGQGSIDTDDDGQPDDVDTDDDNDGVDDSAEDGHPNGGDGNEDDIPDRIQNNVSSFLAFNGEDYITLASLEGTNLSNCQASDIPSSSDSPADIDFPFGFIDFTINGIDSGDSTTLAIYFPEGKEFETYYKYGKTPDQPTDHWYEFLYDGETGAEIDAANNTITLHFKDALRGDDILTEDSMILDLGGPGIKSDDPSPEPNPAPSPNPKEGGGGGGGCFIRVTKK